jgi:hypothetical protein
MKASRWSRGWPGLPSQGLEPATHSLVVVGRVVYLQFLVRHRDGTCSRMRVALTRTEARRLAFDLAAAGKLR